MRLLLVSLHCTIAGMGTVTAGGRMERRLAAIVCADVVGYSRLMGVDEAGTLATLKAHRGAVEPVVLNHGGRVFKMTGDGLLIEFPSVVSAAQAALECQQVMSKRNSEAPEDRRMQFRLGIHMGDVIADENDLYGDGVNIAARVESVAPPGGIAISDKAHSEAVRTIGPVFRDTGLQRLKNIDQPVRVWTWAAGANDEPSRPQSAGTTSRVAIVGVLPFQNLGGSADDEYFSDGMTEDLINVLSKQNLFRVLGRHATFNFKNSDQPARIIARELDATYLVRGSIRRGGGKIRVTAELIEPEGGRQLWSARYDRPIGDLFDLQDEITQQISGNIVPEINWAEVRTRRTLTSTELSAWDDCLKGLFHFYSAGRQDFDEAVRCLRSAIDLDPQLPEPKGLLAITLIHRFQLGLAKSDKQTWLEARQLALDCVRDAPDSALAYLSLAFVSAFSGDAEGSLNAAEKCVALNPFDPANPGMLGTCLFMAGEHQRALDELSRALTLSPNHPDGYHWAVFCAFCHFLLNNFEASLSWAHKALLRNPRHLQCLGIRAAALAELGRKDDAAAAASEFLSQSPELTVEKHLRNFRWRNPDDVAHYGRALKKAGVP